MIAWNLVAVLHATCCLMSSCYGPADEPKFDVVLKRADDKLVTKTMADATSFSIHSPTGIGNAMISRVGDKWPERVRLKLHLKGLECLKISNGNLEFSSEASGPDNRKFLQQVVHGQPQENFGPKPDARSEIRMLGKDGKPAKDIPLESGYFEVLLPKALFESNPKSLTIHWVDFYR